MESFAVSIVIFPDPFFIGTYLFYYADKHLPRKKLQHGSSLQMQLQSIGHESGKIKLRKHVDDGGVKEKRENKMLGLYTCSFLNKTN